MRKYWPIAIVALALLAGAIAPRKAVAVSNEFNAFSSEESTGAYLGVDIADVTPDRLAALKLSKEQGVEVTMVDQDAPAAKAGVKEHDVILTMNGAPIESGAQLRRMIHETPPDRTVSLGISRDGQALTVKVQLAQRGKYMSGNFPRSFKVEMPPMPPMPNFADMDLPISVVVVHSAMRSGLMVENLTPQLGDFFGAKEGHGVLVRSVEKGSRADKAGFRAGDIITRVGDNPVHDTGDFSHALRSERNGGPVRIGIIRDRKEQNITLTLPERKQSGELSGDETPGLPDADISVDVGNLEDDLASLRPKLEYAMRQAARSSEEAQKRLCEQQRELRQRQQELRKQMREQNLKLKQEWKARQREIERELRDLQGNTEI
ncbi:MAG TPA: PDZ domain-containing protein [Terriglobales bacterium]|nr:PDZ domain-containing protein [Terriglobales bacterium]